LFTTTSDTWTQISKTWSPIHGLIYMIYVVLAFDVRMKMRWGLPRMPLLMFFGVVTVLSFFGERWTHQAVENALARRPTLQGEDRVGAAWRRPRGSGARTRAARREREEDCPRAHRTPAPAGRAPP